MTHFKLRSLSLDAGIVGCGAAGILFAQAELPVSTSWQVAAFGLATLALKLLVEFVGRRDAALVENRGLKAELEYYRTRAALLASPPLPPPPLPSEARP